MIKVKKRMSTVIKCNIHIHVAVKTLTGYLILQIKF